MKLKILPPPQWPKQYFKCLYFQMNQYSIVKLKRKKRNCQCESKKKKKREKIHKSEFSSSKRSNCALFFYVGIDDSQ